MKLLLRVRRLADDVVLVERTFDGADLVRAAEGRLQLDLMAEVDAEQAKAAVAEGQAVVLEVCDPEGDIAPASEWWPVHEIEP